MYFYRKEVSCIKEKEKEFESLVFGLDINNKVIEKPVVLFKRLDLQQELQAINENFGE